MLFKLIIGLVGLLVVGGVGFYYLNGINKVGLDHFELTGIKGVSASAFTFDGDLFVKNPSKAPVPIQTITYDVVLDESGEVISTGTLPSFILVPGDNTIPFDQRVNWVPTALLAAELVLNDHVYISVKGRIRIALPQVNEYEIPFSSKVDIKEYILQFANSPVRLDDVAEGAVRNDEPSNLKDDVVEPADETSAVAIPLIS